MHTLEQLRSGALRGITRLDLSAGLTELPREVFELADTLEVLNLSGNQLTALPDDLPRLHRLRVVFCSDNPFTELPPVLGQCEALEIIGFKACRLDHVPAQALPSRLRWLILTDNRLTALPDALGERSPALQKLMLAGNCLSTLPASLAGCERLELLRLAANALASLPGWLRHLPALRWLALAGNPALGAVGEMDRVPGRSIPWSSLAVGERLGEGASGVIHRAEWQVAGEAAQPVAVKLFKGAVTSDGLPRSEMAACLSAGAHPGLIPVHGRISAHPTGTEGLVLGLIDPAFQTLAGPPSLHSCTRDVYPADRRLSAAHAWRTAADIAGAVAHLHAQGLLHGDLYAHNILWHPDTGQALLGDFGAATDLCALDPGLRRALQAFDQRALAVLLHELVAQVDEADADLVRGLRGLADQSADRPAAETALELSRRG